MTNLNLINFQINLFLFNYTYVNYNYNYGRQIILHLLYILIRYSYTFALHYPIYKSNIQTKKLKFKKKITNYFFSI